MITYKTAESVCAGHPDKLCDLIADNILDACMRNVNTKTIIFPTACITTHEIFMISNIRDA